MLDNISNPIHYGGDVTYETIKVLEAWLTPEEYIGFLKGNAIKYNSRHRLKGGLEDLKKAAWYQNKLVDFMDAHGFDGKLADKGVARDKMFFEAGDHKQHENTDAPPLPLDSAVAQGIAKALDESGVDVEYRIRKRFKDGHKLKKRTLRKKP